ncbi:Peptidase family M48 [Lishizhenia tianjinensis]|uniref:Peptidase family M48 n=1 Tax=Lishizhenia tianjinensis TaxID=477690 RepID=A0A1I7B0D2_9FLAO|nr:M48 family metallopeptidase [Lishizhenia tianjinensis]SFT80635.1 Peptidase family M48 [Lishizhenia tianjinensis]
MKNLITSLSTLLLLFQVFAQDVDFNNYKPLKATGELPKTFGLTYAERVAEASFQNLDLSGEERQYFIERKSYSIDQLLHSGLVVYGDPLTEHIKEVASKILFNDTALFNDLSFYTFRTNEANAFVTSDGEVFVTIGLISQLTSDYELAFVLSHEISHYVENHNVEGFRKEIEIEESINGNNFDKQIRALKAYSKQHEIEADELGLKRYLEAGFPLEELVNVFDILAYSYLPIDEVAFDKSYISGENAFIHESLMPTDINEIEFDEDYDDTYHSHPNISKRKDNFDEELLEKYMDFEPEQKRSFNADDFTKIRRMARYERVNNWLYHSDFSNAIYEIYILETKYGSSYTFDWMKALCWTNIAVHASQGSKRDLYSDLDEIQGESYTVHHLMKEMSKDQLVVMAMRNLIDIHNKYPEDKGIELVYKNTVKQLARRFKSLDEFYYDKITVNDSTGEATEAADVEAFMDEDSEEFKALNKYEKIKQKKINAKYAKGVDGSLEGAALDSTEFHLFALKDVANNDEFLKLFNEQQDIVDEDKYDDDEEEKPSVDKLVFVEPLASVVKRRRFSYERNEEVRRNLGDAVVGSAQSLGYQTELLSKYNMLSLGTEGYNSKAMFLRYFYMYSDASINDLISPDFLELEEYKSGSANTNIVFAYVDYNNKRKYDLMVFAFAFDLETNTLMEIEVDTYKQYPHIPVLKLAYFYAFENFGKTEEE